MQAGIIKGANAFLGAPADGEIDCLPLPILRASYEDGTPVCQSVWFPDQEEIEAMIAGHPVMLTAVGLTHPPISIGVAADDYD